MNFPHLGVLIIGLLMSPLTGIAQDGNPETFELLRSICNKIDGPERQNCLLMMAERVIEPDCALGEFWKIQVKEDPMTDVKTCSVTPTIYNKSNGGLFVLISNSGIFFIPSGDEYPRTLKRIRVDKNAPFEFSGSLSGKRAANLASQLVTGKRVLTEFHDWPYNIARHRQIPICDLPQKILDCKDHIK